VVQLSALLHGYYVDKQISWQTALNKGLLVNFEWKQAMRHNSMVMQSLKISSHRRWNFGASSTELSFKMQTV
jgi:L-ribulose-5-phosphate 3-epimerase UlaE